MLDGVKICKENGIEAILAVGDGRVFEDSFNEFTELAKEYDGFIFGSPVYFSGMNGSMMSFMDRVFFSAMSKEPHPFSFKPAAEIVSTRRAELHRHWSRKM